MYHIVVCLVSFTIVLAALLVAIRFRQRRRLAYAAAVQAAAEEAARKRTESIRQRQMWREINRNLFGEDVFAMPMEISTGARR